MVVKRKITRTRSKRRGKTKSLPTRFEPEFLDDLDQRLTATRTLREQLATLLDETGSTTLARQILCKRAVFISVRLETIEAEATATGKFEQTVYTAMCNSLLGLMKTLGLDSKAPEMIDLADYVATKPSKRKGNGRP